MEQDSPAPAAAEKTASPNATAGKKTEERPQLKRLMITEMELENFKSYAGSQKIGPYHKKFTAICGPNGSGKSNVIDAMLFVFGKKAKQIRLDKLSSLIHKSDRYPNLKSARVAVHFQEIIDYEDSEVDFDLVPGTKITLERFCYHDNTSKYVLNGKRSTYQEVTTLLRQCGVDLDHNRFLILQGEVEQISLMKPKAPNEHEDGLLEYIEDIVGTQHYKPQIEEKEKIVEKLSEEREQHMNRVQTAEKDRDSLKDAKKEAEEFLRLDVKLARTQAKFIQIKLVGVSSSLGTKEEEMKDVKKRLDEEKLKHKKDNDKVKEMVAELQTKKAECDEKMKVFEKAQEEYRGLDTAAAEKKQNLEHAQKRIEAQRGVLEKNQEDVQKTNAANKQAEKDVKTAVNELQILEPKLEQAQAEFDEKTDSLQGQLKPLREKHEKMMKGMIPYNEAVTRAEERIKLAEQEKRGILHGTEQVTARLQVEKERQKEAQVQIKQLDKTQKECEADVSRLREKFEKDSRLLDKTRAVQPNIRRRVQELLTTVERLKSQAREIGSGNKVLRQLEQLKEQGGLDGYYGRLGDLGTIPDKFDVPISTAAGVALQHLVCDGEATAKRILSYLKEHNVGRASCVLLDQQEASFGQRCRGAAPKAPAGCTRLFDHIKPSQARFAPVFFWAVRDTLVADTMENATKAAFQGGQRHRVVTYKGELIELSGTMSGGGNVVQSGAMKSVAVSATLMDDLRVAQAELDKVSADEKTVVNKCNELDMAVADAHDIIQGRHREQQQATKDLKGAQQRLGTIELVLKDCERDLVKAKEDAKGENLSRVVKDLERASKDLEAAKFKRKDLDDKMELLKSEMDAVGGPDYARMRDILKITKTGVAKNRETRDQCDAAAKAGQKQLERAESRVAEAQLEVVKAQKEYEQLESQEGADETKMTQAKERLQKVREEYEAEKVICDQMESNREELKAEIRKMRATFAQVEHEFKEKEKEYDGLQVQRNQLNVTLERMEESVKKTIGEFGASVLEAEDIKNPATFNVEEFTVLMSQDEVDALVASGDAALQEVRTKIQWIEETKKHLHPNIQAIKEWDGKNKVFLKRVSDMKVVSEKKSIAQQDVEELKKERYDKFMKSFRLITYKLKEMYQMLTMGGDAELELVDSFDPFTEGLAFCVRPPKKSWKLMSNLSGGEKTLSSLALVFALHHFKPTPLYVMDEIDAALDFKNVSIVANYVKSAAKNAQFIIISLRNNMFELANRLVGIFKSDNCTRSTAVNPSCYIPTLPEQLLSQSQKAKAAWAATAAVKATPQQPTRRPAAAAAHPHAPSAAAPPPISSQPQRPSQASGRKSALKCSQQASEGKRKRAADDDDGIDVEE